MSELTTPELLDRILLLRGIPPFDGLREGELAAVAEACVERIFPPFTQVVRGDRPPGYLYIVVDGWLEREGARLTAVLGEPCLLLGIAPGAPWTTGSEGARCFLLTQAHFFTLLNECPWILQDLLSRLEASGGVLLELGDEGREVP